MTRHAYKVCLNKSCARAGEQLGVSMFGVSKRRPDGRNPYCRKCACKKVMENRASRAVYIQANEKPKACLAATCLRAGQMLEPGEFSINTARRDGRSVYCRVCCMARAKDRPALFPIPNTVDGPKNNPSIKRLVVDVKLPHADRIVEALKLNGPELQAKKLARYARLTLEELSAALPFVHGRERDMPVLSRNGTGPRVYFLKPEPAPAERIDPERFPALTFSNLFHPVMRGRK